jgi:hypothetical protein
MACFDVILTFTFSTLQQEATSSFNPMYRGQGSRCENRDVGVEKQYSGLAEEPT